MKKEVLVIFILFLIFPTIVLANIICNDGTMSPSCYDCHQGCCSHHGGCLNNDYLDENDDMYENYSNFDDEKDIENSYNDNNEFINDSNNNNDYSYLIGFGGAAAFGYYIGKRKDN